MKKYILLYAFGFCLLAGLSAQTALEIETLLETPKVSYMQAARFVLEASEAAKFPNQADAFAFAAERNWFTKKASPETQARLDEISLLLMRSFEIKGGFLYSIVRSPHYAYRELTYLNVIQGRSDPAMAVSGDQLLFMTSRILSMIDENILVTDEAERRKDEQKLLAEISAMLEARNISDTTVSVTDEGIKISLFNIQFRADSAELPESEKPKLGEISQILKNIPQRRLLIAGHTALAGTEEQRLNLSRERAQAVADYLISLGARDASEITVTGYGAEQPIADNNNAVEMAKNRRVEIIILENR